MKNLLGFAPSLLLALMASSASAYDKTEKDTSASDGPAYDVSTVVDISVTVNAVREVPNGKPLSGLHLTVQSGFESLDVYVGPAEFVKVFDVTFAKGDQLQVVGSKVKFEGSNVVLAREVTKRPVILLIRDKDGAPLWKYFLKPPQG